LVGGVIEKVEWVQTFGRPCSSIKEQSVLLALPCFIITIKLVIEAPFSTSLVHDSNAARTGFDVEAVSKQYLNAMTKPFLAIEMMLFKSYIFMHQGFSTQFDLNSRYISLCLLTFWSNYLS
jgi:hypothetical protein